MLYNDLGKNLMTMGTIETFIEKVSNRVKMEKANSKALYLPEESYRVDNKTGCKPR